MLRPSGPWRQIKGEDARGRYKGRARRYGALEASYAVYADAVVFTQRFPDGATVSPRGVDGRERKERCRVTVEIPEILHIDGPGVVMHRAVVVAVVELTS